LKIIEISNHLQNDSSWRPAVFAIRKSEAEAGNLYKINLLNKIHVCHFTTPN
jgi:hypothetical protein